MSKISFNNTKSPFYKTLKQKVNDYFNDQQLSRTGGIKLFLKSLFISSTAVTIYVLLVFFNPPVVSSLILCCLLGVNLATIGFNIMHEGGHGSFSKYKWLNDVSAYSLHVLGGTIHFWKQRHNIDHHTYTNIEGKDHDIDVKFMRMHKEQRRFGYHRFQHLYWVLLYGISYMAWILYQDFEKYFSLKKDIASRAYRMDRRGHLIFWLTKIGYIFIYIILPMTIVGWMETIIGFLIVGTVIGLFMSVVFQLAHVVEGTQFPEPDETNKIQREWAVHQISTTANFATNNKIISWFLGGLNYQVEHHLFPDISHIHYPKINKLVKETCQEFNIAYLEHHSLTKAFYSHIVHIKKLGNVE